MASVINIGKDARGDKFHRYKMPQLVTKIEGKGNGIKTVLPNMADIAKALARPPSYPTKFFGCELGAQTTFDDKTERYIVNGAHDAPRLRELLDTFIDKFVLCASCKNPETDIVIDKGNFITRDCKACGHRGEVDMRHKLTTFILKNPPEVKKMKSRKGTAAKVDAASGDADGGDNGDEEIEPDADELTRTIAAGAAQISLDDKEKDVEWSVDMSEEAVRSRQRSLGGVASLVQGNGEDDEEGEDENSPYYIFQTWLKEEKSKDAELKPVDIYRKAQDLGIQEKAKTLTYLVLGLFDENIVKEVEPYAGVINKLLGTSEKHQKAFMGGIERLIGNDYPALVPATSKILYTLYDTGAFDDEEFYRSWAKHVSKKYVDKDTSKKVRKAAADFITWLDNASESEEEDDE